MHLYGPLSEILLTKAPHRCHINTTAYQQNQLQYYLMAYSQRILIHFKQWINAQQKRGSSTLPLVDLLQIALYFPSTCTTRIVFYLAFVCHQNHINRHIQRPEHELPDPRPPYMGEKCIVNLYMYPVWYDPSDMGCEEPASPV